MVSAEFWELDLEEALRSAASRMLENSINARLPVSGVRELSLKDRVFIVETTGDEPRAPGVPWDRSAKGLQAMFCSLGLCSEACDYLMHLLKVLKVLGRTLWFRGEQIDLDRKIEIAVAGVQLPFCAYARKESGEIKPLMRSFSVNHTYLLLRTNNGRELYADIAHAQMGPRADEIYVGEDRSLGGLVDFKQVVPVEEFLDDLRFAHSVAPSAPGIDVPKATGEFLKAMVTDKIVECIGPVEALALGFMRSAKEWEEDVFGGR